MLDVTPLCLLGNYLIIAGISVLIFSKPLLFFLENNNNSKHPNLNGPYHWYAWPAVAANAFFIKCFGKRGTGIRGLLTWRSVCVTMLVSLIANMFCIVLIMNSIPHGAPTFDLNLIKILTLSHFVFIIFNLSGDLISISITRHALDKMVNNRKKYIYYICIDILGVFIGYLITLAPTIIAILYALQTKTDLNQLIQAGIFGNVLIPFFLLIFASSGQPLPITIFALIAVFSITIPTVIYLYIFVFINLCHLIKIYLLDKKTALLVVFLGHLRSVGNIIFIIGTLITALSAIIKYE